jgi:hypothetical protein
VRTRGGFPQRCVREIFELLDSDGDQLLSAEEMRLVMHLAGAAEAVVPPPAPVPLAAFTQLFERGVLRPSQAGRYQVGEKRIGK